MKDAIDRAALRALDAADPLADRRELFALPDGVVYLDGNSLGALPRATQARMAAVIADEWGRDLIGSWNTHGWIEAPRRIGARIARLVGAEPHEVVVADSTSANLFKLLAAGMAARPDRSTILSEPGNFPTDLYIADGVAGIMPGRRLKTADADAIVDAIDDDTAVVMLTHVHYKTGRKLDMAAITAAAHARGALVLWDLSHSAGAVEIDLDGCGVDLAVGCGYKYFNGGPGAPAFLFVRAGLQDTLQSPLSGWMGHAAPFAFTDDYAPAPGITRFLCGTPPILAMAALEQGIATFDGIDMGVVRAKSLLLTQTLIDLVDQRCGGMGLTLITPRDGAIRGSHVAYTHEDAHALCQALIARGLVGDFRAPDAVRFGVQPLYTAFEDIWRAVDILHDVLVERAWDQPRYRVRAAVT